jgi:hypothetical protein
MGLGISDAVTLSGRLVELAKTTMTLDLQEQIAQLREAVLNAKEEILSLREERGELHRAAALREQVKFDGSLYWRDTPERGKDGPFCQRCYDVESRLVRLQHYPQGFGFPWQCLHCSKGYQQK